MAEHIPVLLADVLDGLQLAPGMTVLDGTLGLGGHTAHIIAATSPDGKVIGFDADDRNLALARERLGALAERVVCIHDSYANVANHNVPPLDGALLDLGFSSVHVDDASRGFSFMRSGPLDMRYDKRRTTTAADIVNTWSREDLASLFRVYGEDQYANNIANAICDERKKQPFTTTTQLAEFIVQRAGGRGRIHPATKIFQALRISVNDELGELERGLQNIMDALKPGARLAVISFHSLEDRAVKDFFNKHIFHERLSPVTKKPITASLEETRANPRSRSAKLRIVEKR